MDTAIPRKRPLGITIVVVVADIGALLRLIGSIVVIVAAVAAAPRVPGGIRAVIVGLAIWGIAIALGILVVGHFLWKGANWARIVLMVILLAGVVLTVIGMFLSGVDAESVISIVIPLVFVAILNSASVKQYCESTRLGPRSVPIAVAGVLNVGYGVVGCVILVLPTLVAWGVALSPGYPGRGMTERSLALVVSLLQVSIAGAMTMCWLLCMCLVVSGIGILLMKEWARSQACTVASVMVVSALVFLTACICAEVGDLRLLGSKLGFLGVGLLAALVVLALAWPVTMNFLLSTAKIKAQFVESVPAEGPSEPVEPEDVTWLAQVRRQERKELLCVCVGVVALLVAVAVLAVALPQVRWKATPRKKVPVALKRPIKLVRQGKHEEAIPLLLEALRSEEFSTRRAAGDALAEIGQPAVPALAKLLKNGEDDISTRIEMVLSKMGAAAIPAYMEVLKSQNEGVRRMAVYRLGRMGAEGIPGLREALKSEDQNVRFGAIEALKKIGAPAVPALREAVENPDSYIRRSATEALRQIAAYDTAAVEALAEALKDESGKSPLHYAAEAGNVEAMKELIKKGAELSAKDALGNTALFVIVENMMMPMRRRSGNYTRYKEAAEFLIAKGADVDATGKFGRTLLQHAQALGREDIARFLIAMGAKTHFDRRIYFKLPLQGVRFHWRFFDRAAYLRGHLVLRIWGRSRSPQEITVFKKGKLADGWHMIGEGSRAVSRGGAYFGFQSSERYETAKGDDVEIELRVAQDLLGGWGPKDYGILPRNTYNAKGKIHMVSNELQAATLEGKEIRASGWTAFLKWHTDWQLLKDDANGTFVRTWVKMLKSQDSYARLRAAQVLGQLDDQSAAPALIRAMRGADKRLRGAVKVALGQLGNPEIYMLDAQGGNPVNLTQSPAQDRAPAWSPDGTKIAFASDRDGDFEIYVMEADGSNLRRLTHSPGTDTNPAWSPDGTRIAFRSQRDKNCEVYVMNADGTGQMNISNSPGCDHDPVWSPGGDKIAFQSTRNEGCDIYVMDPDGGNAANVTSRAGCDHHPAWFPDGEMIAFSARQDGNWGLHSVHADGSHKALLLSGTCDASIAWSPDGKRIVLTSEDIMSPWVFTMSSDGSNARILTELPGLCTDPTWSPNGAALALSVNIFDPSILPEIIEASRSSGIYEQCHNSAPSGPL